MEAELDLSKCKCFDGGSTWHDGAMAWEYHLEPNPDCRVHFPASGLSVKFQEPQPTVGGLTGEQLSLFRQIQAENHCWYEVYPVSPKGAAEYCIEPREPWSSYCEEHAFIVAQEQPYYDEYDIWRDYPYEE